MLDLLGIGVGKLALSLEVLDYRLGQTIKGRVALALNEPCEAKRLVVGVEATQRVVSRRSDSVGLRRDTVWRFERELAGEGVFQGVEKRFSLKLPTDLDRASPPPDTLLGEVAQVISFLSPDQRFPLEWSVFAFLDRPWKVNVKTRVGITVAPRAKKKL